MTAADDIITIVAPPFAITWDHLFETKPYAADVDCDGAIRASIG